MKPTARALANQDGEESRHLGDLVEAEVIFRCKQAYLTVNKSSDDTQGWDLLVQFRESNDIRPLLDLSPPQKSCLLQVKGTRSPNGTVRMTLSNALRLARYPGPAFLLIAHASANTIKRWWLLHWDKYFVEMALRRLVDEEQRSTRRPLNKILLSMNTTSGLSLPVDGPSLRNALDTHIGPDPYHYHRQKETWLSSVGYADDTKQVDLTIGLSPRADRLRQLARFAVGLEKELPIEKLSIYDLRFGTKRHQETHHQTKIEMPDVPSLPPVRLEVRSSNSGETLTFDAKVYVASAVFPFLKHEHNIFRVVTPYFEFVSERTPSDTEKIPAQWRVNGIGSGLTERTLGDMLDSVTAMTWVIAGEATLAMLSERDRRPISLGSPAEPKAELRDLLRTLKDFGTVTRAFGMPLTDERVSLDDILAQRTSLMALAAIATGADPDIKWTAPHGAPPHGVALGDRCAMLLAPWFGTEKFVLVVVTAVVGIAEEDPDNPGGRTIKCKRLWELSRRLAPHDTPLNIEEMYQEAETNLAGMGITKAFRPVDEAEGA